MIVMIGKLFFWFIVIANLIGAGFGVFVYYWAQLGETFPLLWIFVIDCPLYAFLFAIAFYYQGKGRPHDLKKRFRNLPDLSLLWFITIVGAMKYGFWTMFVLATYSGYYFTPGNEFLYQVLFISHAVLFFQTLLLVGKVKVRFWYLGVALFWFLLNDVVDYVLLTHPPLPPEALGFMLVANIAMSIVFSLFGYGILKNFSQEKKV